LKYLDEKTLCFSLLSILLFSGCAHIPTLDERKATALNFSSDKALTQTTIKTSTFNLFSMQKLSQCENKDMKVYIEGDGLAWVTRNRISDDPTPLNPIGLSLMLSDESECKVYIARPCQYVQQDICENKYWTSHRFNTKIIQSFDEALSNLKENHKNSSFTLVGYSGGGAVAALTASKRDDVSRLITVAGNIDTDKWVSLQHISPLEGSLNPANYTKRLENIPQYHLIGNDDNIVPKDIFFSYLNKFENKNNVKYFTYDATHTKNWEQHYKNFLKGLKTDESTNNR
jgi:hypothetical protein